MNVLKLLGWLGAIALVVHFCSEKSEPTKAVAAEAPVSASNSNASFPLETTGEDDGEAQYQCYSGVTERLGELITAIKACDLEEALLKGEAKALSALPAAGFKDGVAGVFKKHKLHINKNAEVLCSDKPTPELAPTAGCYLSIYVSRVRASGKYSDLAGWHAVWFRGIADKAFRPMNNVAAYLTKADPGFLKSGGMLDNEDRP